MDNLAKIRRWIATNDYEAIGTFLDENRSMDELESMYLNEHVPKERKEAWNDFIEKGLCLPIDVSRSNVDMDRMIRVVLSPIAAMGGVWRHTEHRYEKAHIALQTLQPTPFGNEVICSVTEDKEMWTSEYLSFEVLVHHDQNEYKLWLYHNQTFKFNL